MDKQEIIKKLEKNEIKLHKVDQYASNANEATDIRREFIEKQSQTELKNISKYSIDMTETTQKILKIQ